MDGSGQAHQGLYVTRKQQASLHQAERGKRLKESLLAHVKYLLPQSKADEFVSTGLKEVLDVFLPAHTQTGCSQILEFI